MEVVELDTPDFIDPTTEDWQTMDDATVYYAAQQGIPQARSELDRRNKLARAAKAVHKP